MSRKSRMWRFNVQLTSSIISFIDKCGNDVIIFPDCVTYTKRNTSALH